MEVNIMERPFKRRRTLEEDDTLPTPPASDCDMPAENTKLLDRATHILATEAAALSYITRIYQHNPIARQGLTNAVENIVQAHQSGSKLIVCGVGKSAYIAMKLVATLKSLGVGASFLHASEAAHGDLGDVRQGDIVLFVSFSGKTPELLSLLPHLRGETQVMAISSHMDSRICPLLQGRDDSVLLPAPIPESEEVSFGVAAPTTSTTAALAIADMLALTVADQIHSHESHSALPGTITPPHTTRTTKASTKEVFKRNHPGGAIGMSQKEVERLKRDGIEVSVVEVPGLELPSPSISAQDDEG